MKPTAVRPFLVVCAAAVLLGALVASVRTGGVGPADAVALAEGVVFSEEDGDRVDVYYTSESAVRGCVNVGGVFYGSGISCFDPSSPDGSYVAIPASIKTKPPLVVGLMPAGASGVSVAAGRSNARITMRGRWFVAELPPGALGAGNRAQVEVEFER